MAAVLACGDGAALSHLSAAALWSLLEPQQGPIHVSVPTRAGRRRRQGIRIHRSATLLPRSISRHHRIPVTTPARTIADLRGAVPPSQHRRAIRQAEVRGYPTGLARGSEPTRSELEDLFLRLCSLHRLPKPEVNVRIGGHEVDFLWRPQRVIVETDGYRFHRGSQAFEDDHERDLELRSRGYDLLRLSHRQITANPERAAAAVVKALSNPDGRKRASE